MAGHQYNNSQMPRMDHMNRLHHEPPPFGQKLFIHPRNDAPNGSVSAGYGGVTIRSNDLPSSSYIGQSYGQQIGAPGTLHASYAGHPPAGSSTSSYAPYNTQHVPALNHPHRPEDNFLPSSHVDDRRVALKRRNPIVHPTDGISTGGYYPGSSSNTQLSGYMPPNPVRAPEVCPPQIPSNLGSSHWNDLHFVNHEGCQRNVRGRHDHNSIHLERNLTAACPSSSIRVPPYHPNASGPLLRTPVERDRAPLSLPPRIVPPVTDGSNGVAFRERPYYPAPQSTSISAPVPTRPGSSDSVPFAHCGYVPRVVPRSNTHSYPLPAFASSSNSGAVSLDPANTSYPHAIPSCPPSASVASLNVQPFHAEAAATLRRPRHVSVGSSGSARSRRARDSYHGFQPLIEDNNLGRLAAERFMMLDQLVIHESREAFDPHWDLRLDIDDMSYEELLALGERIGNVDTGLADEKISGCVMEVAWHSYASAQKNDQGNEICVICLEEYKHRDSLGCLKCGHDFHAACIKEWLQVKNTCPVCKASAADDDSS